MATQQQQQQQDEHQASCAALFVECRGLRYALPYEAVSKPTFLKTALGNNNNKDDAANNAAAPPPSLADVLGRLYRRHRGQQPIAESTAYWQAEIKAGRVEWRFAKTSRHDSWPWHSYCSDNDNNNKNNNSAEQSNNKNHHHDDEKKKKNHGVVVVVAAQPGMSVRFRQHVHEKVVPALGDIVRRCILYEDSHVVALNKPAGLAVVDETGGHGVNALLTMLGGKQQQQQQETTDTTSRKQQQQQPQRLLTPAHRLDKPVSGVLWLGKSTSQAAKLWQTIQADNGVQKIYIARCCRRPSKRAAASSSSSSTTAAAATTTTASLDVKDLQDADFTFPTRQQPVTVTLDLTWNARQRRSVPCTTEQSAQRVKDRAAHNQGQAKRRAKKRQARARRERGGGGFRTADGNQDHHHHNSSGPVVHERTEESPTKPHYANTSRGLGHHTTIFRRLGEALPDGTILVQCEPQTGYRHQIRAHLASLGWPIVHDAAYGGHGGGNTTSTSNTAAPLRAFVDDDMGTLRRALVDDPAVWRPWCPKCQWTRSILSSTTQSQEQQQPPREESTVPTTPSSIEVGIAVDAAGIWLHSYRYVIPSLNLDVVAPLPDWAKDATEFLSHD